MIRSSIRSAAASLLVGLSICLVPDVVWATTSGLNNIPTADVTPAGVLVLQQITNSGSDQETLAHLGFKLGLAKDWEIGLDKRVHSSGSGSGVGGAGGLPAGPWVFQGKYRCSLPGDRTAVGLGVANIGEDSRRAGDSFPYAVISHDADVVRVHGGHSWQDDSPAWFVGVDKTLPSGLTLRADWIEASNQEESVTSVGFIKGLGGPWLVEGWVSLPSEGGVEDTLTLKFDYVITFGG
jgi:hypothetical protein